MNLPSKLEEPLQTKHKRIYSTVNKILDYLDEHYEPEEENEYIGTINSESKVFTPAGGASPSNKATNYMQVGKTIECGHCNAKDYGEGLKQAERVIPNFVCACECHKKPHWESDYAAIWERHDEGYGLIGVRQDILELIRRIVK